MLRIPRRAIPTATPSPPPWCGRRGLVSKPPDSSTSVTFRIPVRLEREIKTLARRDEQSLSATVRRLIVIALRTEPRDAEGDRRG